MICFYFFWLSPKEYQQPQLVHITTTDSAGNLAVGFWLRLKLYHLNNLQDFLLRTSGLLLAKRTIFSILNNRNSLY